MKIDGILAVFIAGYYVRVIFQQKSLIISIYIYFFLLASPENIFFISLYEIFIDTDKLEI